jgi:hypothetical protein
MGAWRARQDLHLTRPCSAASLRGEYIYSLTDLTVRAIYAIVLFKHRHGEAVPPLLSRCFEVGDSTGGAGSFRVIGWGA